MGPRKLWRTTIVIWTDIDPQKIPPGQLVRSAEIGKGYLSVCHSELIADPYSQLDGPPTDYFVEGEPTL